MKKLIVLILILSVFLLVSCASEIVRNGGVVEHCEPKPSADLHEAYSDEDIVYVTKSGTKFHREDCKHLSKSKIPISLEQALKQGLEPCKACSPTS